MPHSPALMLRSGHEAQGLEVTAQHLVLVAPAAEADGAKLVPARQARVGDHLFVAREGHVRSVRTAPGHAALGTGGRQRREPVGASAYGMPRKREKLAVLTPRRAPCPCGSSMSTSDTEAALASTSAKLRSKIALPITLKLA